MLRTNAVPTPARAPVVSTARYIGDDTAIVQIPQPIALDLGLSDGTRLLWAGSARETMQVTVTLAGVDWRADSDPDVAFPAPAATVVRYMTDAVLMTQIPPAFTQVLDLVDTARLRWEMVDDRVAQVAIDPADIERVQTIREKEDDRAMESINRLFGAIPDFPTRDEE